MLLLITLSFLLILMKKSTKMYNQDATQNIFHEDFYILLLMGGCARIPCGVLGSHDRPFLVGSIK